MTPPGFKTRLRFFLRRMGWPAWLGLLLLLTLWPLAHWGADLPRAQALALRQQASRPPSVQVQADPLQQAMDRQARLQERLAEPLAALSTVERLHRGAAERGLSLASGEYRVLAATSTAPQRYQISLPVAGAYPRIRAWLADTMNAQPGLALEELSFSRNSVADAQVQARVRWTLYLKEN